jgi:hypothetical protein
MSPSRARTFGLLLPVLVGAAVLWRFTLGRAEKGLLNGDDEARAPMVGKVQATNARRMSVPKLFAPPGFGEASEDGPEPAAGNDELDVEQRAQIDQIEASVRAAAAASLGLSDAEVARIGEIRADLDARRGRFEAQIDPTTRMLEPHASVAILGNARAEQRALERALGPERAAALREAERAAYARLVLTRLADAGAAPPPPARRMLARRMGARPSASPR